MHFRFILVALTAMLSFAVATPPACLLAVMGIQSNPADLKLMCGDVQSFVLGNMTTACQGSNLSPAYDAYSSTCSSIGAKVAALPSATASASGSSPTASQTKGSSSSSATGTPTGSGANPTASGKNNAAGMAPSFMFAATGLLATTLGGLIFL